MENKFFYIIVKNRFYHHDCNNYHIERIFSKEETLKVIEDIIEQMGYDGPEDKYHPYIITNDNELLLKYMFTLSFSDFKMLCGLNNYSQNEIRINPNYFRKFDLEVFYYFLKIKNDGIVSANEYWSSFTLERFDLGDGHFEFYENTGRGELTQDYEGWQVNKKFDFFKTTPHYKNINGKPEEVFRIKNIKSVNINKLNELIEDDILELEWEERKGCLVYFNKQNLVKLVMISEVLEKIKLNPILVLRINTSLDKNHIITYFVDGIYNENSRLSATINYTNSDCEYPLLYDKNKLYDF